MTKDEAMDRLLDVTKALIFLAEDSKSPVVHEVVCKVASERLLELSIELKGLKRFT